MSALTPDEIAERITALAADADAAVMADCQLAGYVLGKLCANLVRLACALENDVMADYLRDHCPPQGMERPPEPKVSTHWLQTTDDAGNIWWTERRLPKKGERYVDIVTGNVDVADHDFSTITPAVIVGGPVGGPL